MTATKKQSESSDYDKMIAHIKDPFKIVCNVLLEIPDLYDMQYPRDCAVELYTKNMANFVIRNFKNVTPNEIKESCELNTACKLPKNIDTWGKLSIQTIGPILNSFLDWRRANRPRHVEVDTSVNVRFELTNDYNKYRTSPNTFVVNQYIDEKWEWLIASEDHPYFNSNLDEEKIEEYELYYKNRKVGTIGKSLTKLIGGKTNHYIWALQRFKAERITEYIAELIENRKGGKKKVDKG